MPSRVRLVTLSTDIGSAYAAQMKGVLYGFLPAGHVVDLTHDLPRHRVAESAFLVRQMVGAFPPGAVHLVVVDPGVGGDRAPIAIRTREGSYLVGPDNGVLWPTAERLGIAKTVRLAPPRVAGASRVGRTFDGRDLFAPAAARLARGARLDSLGKGWAPRPLRLPTPTVSESGVKGTIVHIDHFGNAITNIPSSAIAGRSGSVSMKAGSSGVRRALLCAAYEELRLGQLGVLPSSFGTLELAAREGSAASRLGVKFGAAVTLRWPGGRSRAVGGK
jgi:S-adenosyl-L-methionine hydrolase (adenosine-forming)